MFVYMEVTKDKYSLPIRICDSVDELSRETNLNYRNVASQVSRGTKGEIKNPRFIRVEIDENTDF